MRLWFYIIQGFTNGYEKVWFQLPMRNEHFLIVIYHSSLVKGAMNAARVCKLRNGVKKNASISSIFNGQSRTKCAMNISAAI
jgi:hypothetical protein